MTDPLVDDAIQYLKLAIDLEERRGDKMGAATKYYEATYLMKRYVERLPMVPSKEKERQLLQQKIDHYEAIACQLLKEADGNKNPAARNNTPQESASPKHDPRSPIARDCFFAESPKATTTGFEVVFPAAIATMTTTTTATNSRDPSGTPSTNVSSNNPEVAALADLLDTLSKTAGQANSHLSRALDLHEVGKTQQATDEYIKASELYLHAIKLIDKHESSYGNEFDSVKQLLSSRACAALDRLEMLKKVSQNNKQARSHNRLGHSTTSSTVFSEIRTTRVQPKERPSVPSLKPEEIKVLRDSSLIASGLFLPFLEKDVTDLHKRNSSMEPPFLDKGGELKLSDKQQQRFHTWARPSEILRLRKRASARQKTPIMIKTISPYTIEQRFVTDCSFIASLCVCAAFERRFNKRLITSIIYPQDENGTPVLSKTGEYIVKLWLNGVARTVTVDDRLPVDAHGNLLCSQTVTSKLELWVCIIEKAYMKLCGGYDFPGSNSGVDLFSLTGWIPERVFFPKNLDKIKDHETPPERAWERLYGACSFGDCLITVSSSMDITEDEAESVGLVTGHAYAVLDVIQTQDGTRLLQLKNPWARKGWKGRYSPEDMTAWSDNSFCEEVGYNSREASKHDDGVFWICWEDLLHYFQNVHMSWNPALFKFQTTVHGAWPANQGPANDSFFVGDNPQYVIKLSDEAIRKKSTKIWILLSRHVTKQEQEGSEVKDFLTAHIHRSNDKMTNRIWYPGGKTCVLTGAYSNNPHVLIRYDVQDERDKRLVVVLSQYKKSHDINYTLSCYCTESFQIGRPKGDLPYKVRLQSGWTEKTAGGPPLRKGFGTNPQWCFRVGPDGADVQLRCSVNRTFAVNVMVVQVNELVRVRQLASEPIIDSGPYRHGFVVTDTKRLPPGFYITIASTYNPGQVGAFFLDVFSSDKLAVHTIP